MSSQYSTDLRIELIGNGEQSGVWGTTTNNNLGTLIEQAIAGTAYVTVTSANQALTVYNGVSDESRCAAVSLSTTTAAPFNVYIPPVSKLYVFINTTAYAATVYASTVAGNTTAAGSGVSLAANSRSFVYCDGTNAYDALNHISGTLFVENDLTVSTNVSVGNNLTVTGSSALGASQTATITTANPAVITVTNAPKNNTTVSFTTTGSLPANITAGTLYYVVNRTSTTFNVATSAGGTPISTASGSQAGTHTVSTVPTAATAASGANSTQLATTAFVANAIGAIPGATTYQTLAAVVAATTENITLAAPQTIDGISIVAGDRVLVKDQTTAANNGVYVAAAGAWARATDANTSAEIAAALVPVLKGTTNGGKNFITGFKSTDSLGTTAMSWDFLITGTSPTITTPTITSPTITTPTIDVIKSSSTSTPTVFQNSAGEALGTICRAWVNFNGLSTGGIKAAFNVTSVTRNSIGVYTLNFSTDFTNSMPDANYASAGNCTGLTTGDGTRHLLIYGTAAAGASLKTTSQFKVSTMLSDASGASDMAEAAVMIFR